MKNRRKKVYQLWTVYLVWMSKYATFIRSTSQTRIYFQWSPNLGFHVVISEKTHSTLRNSRRNNYYIIENIDFLCDERNRPLPLREVNFNCVVLLLFSAKRGDKRKRRTRRVSRLYIYFHISSVKGVTVSYIYIIYVYTILLINYNLYIRLPFRETYSIFDIQ